MSIKVTELSTEEKMIFWGTLLSALGLTLIQLGKLLKSNNSIDKPILNSSDEDFNTMSFYQTNSSNKGSYWED